MRNNGLLKVVALLVLCVVAFGFYRGWFVLSSSKGEGNTVDVNLKVDPDKAKEDAKAVEAKARDLGSKVKEEVPPQE
jgi:hypothetical protein